MFKRKFSQKEVAQDFLRYNLPPKVLQGGNLNTLVVIPNYFLASKYRSSRSADLIYAADAKQGKKLYALCHLEAQSKQDKFMALCVFAYQLAIMMAYAKANTKKEDKKPPTMPLILTCVLYSGG